MAAGTEMLINLTGSLSALLASGGVKPVGLRLSVLCVLLFEVVTMTLKIVLVQYVF